MLIVATGLLIATLAGCSARPFENLGEEMNAFVAGVVRNDKSVRNCVLSITKGDASFSWSGASGIALEKGQAEPSFLQGSPHNSPHNWLDLQRIDVIIKKEAKRSGRILTMVLPVPRASREGDRLHGAPSIPV